MPLQVFILMLDNAGADALEDGVAVAHNEGISYYDGITLEDAVLCDDDDDELWDQYHLYLAQWIMDHHDIECKGSSPLTYDQWIERNHDSSMDLDSFIEMMGYPHNNRVLAVSIEKARDEFEDHIRVLGYIEGNFDFTVFKPQKCFLDSFCRDQDHSGDVMDYIRMFSATHATFAGDEEDPAEKAITYLRDIYIDNDMVIHRAERCLILQNEDMDDLLALPAGVYLVGIK